MGQVLHGHASTLAVGSSHSSRLDTSARPKCFIITYTSRAHNSSLCSPGFVWLFW